MRAVAAVALVLALIAACRGDHHGASDPHAGSGSAAAQVVPHLTASTSGADELRMLGERIERNPDRPAIATAAVLERATYLGQLDDYRDALARSAQWVEHAPTELDAWLTRVRVLTAVHDFAAAQIALESAKRLAVDPSQWQAAALAIDEATGSRERVLAAHEATARAYPNAVNLTHYAAVLALAGRFDEAIALIPRAAAEIHNNTATIFAWLLFQWGRIYELNGDLGAARQFYTEACARFPGYLEATTHLAQTEIATGDRDAAIRVVGAALAHKPSHPALLELGAQLGISTLDAARDEWQRYLDALPLAFADHAARFYLGVGADPRRALELATANLANRDVPEARALVVEAALAAANVTTACAAAAALASAPLRAHRFLAWRAFVACGRTDDASRLAKDLGISP